MNCLKKMVSDSLVLVFDSLTILLSGPLPDTVVDVNQKSISLPPDKVLLTLHGMDLCFPLNPMIPKKLRCSQMTGNLFAGRTNWVKRR